MIELSYNTFLNTLSERELLTLAQKDCKYSTDAKTALLKKYQPYIYNLLLAYPYYTREDLEILAYVGLLKAIELFDLSRGLLLITYAQFFIKKELVNYIKNDLQIVAKEVNELIYIDTTVVDYNTYEALKSQHEAERERTAIENRYDQNIELPIVESFLNDLNEQQRLVATLVYYRGYSQSEVAKLLKISKPRVTQILNSIKQKGQNKLSYFKNN